MASICDIKCVIVGDKDAGKTSFLTSYKENKYVENRSVVHPEPVPVTFNGKTYMIALHDTAGAEDHDNIRWMNYPNTEVFLVCFSVASPSSFESVKKTWVPEITNHCPETPFLLVGTQIELRDDPDAVAKLAKNKQMPIDRKQAEQLAKELRAVKYVECSAFMQKGLKNVFDEAISAVIKKEMENSPNKSRKCCTML